MLLLPSRYLEVFGGTYRVVLRMECAINAGDHRRCLAPLPVDASKLIFLIVAAPHGHHTISFAAHSGAPLW